MKALTRDQVASRKEKAERFVRNVLGDEDRAAEIADESIEDYAQHRKFEIINPQRNKTMAKKNPTATKQELLERVAELEQENQDLADQLDAIADIVSPDDDNSDDDQDDGDSDDDQDDGSDDDQDDGGN